MDTRTGAIVDERSLTEEERNSGHFIKLPPEYVRKQPVTQEDFDALNTADRKRTRRAAIRAMFSNVSETTQ